MGACLNVCIGLTSHSHKLSVSHVLWFFTPKMIMMQMHQLLDSVLKGFLASVLWIGLVHVPYWSTKCDKILCHSFWHSFYWQNASCVHGSQVADFCAITEVAHLEYKKGHIFGNPFLDHNMHRDFSLQNNCTKGAVTLLGLCDSSWIEHWSLNLLFWHSHPTSNLAYCINNCIVTSKF